MNEKIINELAATFLDAFHQEPLIVRSPGRINLIGEHTDYNEGFVMPAAINKAVYLAIGLRDDQRIEIIAKDFQQSFSINTHDLRAVAEPAWPNYLIGVVAQFKHRRITVPGFNAVIASDLPVGAGMSSSAAVECATVFALNDLLSTNLDRLEMVHMAQKAEHEYAGVMCGIMDQFASMFGKKDHAISLDCRSLEYHHVPFKPKRCSILMLNTNVKHSLASSAYNERRNECALGVKILQEQFPSVKSLRDVSARMIYQNIEKFIDNALSRCLYVVEENERVLNASHDLERGDLHAFGQKMLNTHDGLSKLYKVSCAELDFLVEKTRSFPGVFGARMMGGGFGGCTINLLNEAAVDPLIQELREQYENKFPLSLSHYVVSVEDGTSIVRQPSYV